VTEPIPWFRGDVAAEPVRDPETGDWLVTVQVTASSDPDMVGKLRTIRRRRPDIEPDE